MKSFPDISFLYSVYRTQNHSRKADTFMAKLVGPLPVSTFLLLEFRQSLRLQARLNAQDKTKGFSKREAALMLRDLQSDLAAKVLEVVPVDWADVHQIAERLSATHTEQNGHRLVDILQVATALHLAAAGFLTFDGNQRLLAEAEGLKVTV
jgi:predicted nucleic acid-binding protein